MQNNVTVRLFVKSYSAFFFISTFALNLLFSSAVFAENSKDADPWDNSDHVKILMLDTIIPGYGSFRMDAPISGWIILSVRLFTLNSAYNSWYYREKYRSSMKAARLADMYYGPGLTYYDTIHGGFKNSYQFESEMKKYNSYYTLSLSAHAAAVLFSFVHTWKLSDERRKKFIPTFEISPENVGFRFTLRGF